MGSDINVALWLKVMMLPPPPNWWFIVLVCLSEKASPSETADTNRKKAVEVVMTQAKHVTADSKRVNFLNFASIDSALLGPIIVIAKLRPEL